MVLLTEHHAKPESSNSNAERAVMRCRIGPSTPPSPAAGASNSNTYELEKFEDLEKILSAPPDQATELSLLLTGSDGREKWRGQSNGSTWKLPDTLKYLALDNFPLSRFREITKLTDFILIDSEFAQPLDTLLDFLKGNPSIERLTLWIKFKNHTDRHPKRSSSINLERLKSLSATFDRPECIGYLLSCITLPKNAHLDFSTIEGEIGLDYILSRAKGVGISPTRMLVNYSDSTIRWSGPDGKLVVSSIPRSEMCFVLTGEFLTPHEGTKGMTPVLTTDSLPSFKRVEKLRLVMFERSSVWPPLDPSRFPALKTLTIERGVDIPTTLSKLISSEQLSTLDKLEIKNCDLSEGSAQILKQCAFECGHTMTSRGGTVTIAAARDFEYVF